jgi:ATP-dependent RNA helicase DDX46/PRP5
MRDSRDRDYRRDYDRDDRRDRDRDYDRRDRDRDRRDDRRDDRRNPSPRRRDDRERERERDREQRDDRRDSRTNGRAASGTPGPGDEEEKKRQARERLEAWKRQRKAQGSNVTSAAGTPEPEKPSPKKREFAPRNVLNSAAAPKSGLSFSATSLSSLKPTPLKRSFAALDDEEVEDRKLEKLDLPAFNPEVQSGTEAGLQSVDEDMAVAQGDDNENDAVAGAEANGNGSKMDVDEEEEEDPLDAFMRENAQQVKTVNVSDAKRSGNVAADESDGEDEETVRNRAEEELSKAEAMLQQAASKSRKKDLPTPDHDNIDYEPFRKNFYTVPEEAAVMDEEEAELIRLEMDGIRIRGTDAPKPVRRWGAFGIPLGCLEVIQQKEWTAPTPIQAQSIPAIMSGRDVIGVAKTGSGKTIAFLLPMLRHVKDQRPVSGLDGPVGLILAPTRELAMQIYREAKPFAKIMGLRLTCAVGGQSISDDIATMKKGCEIVVCTPGRMIDLLTANNGRVTNLRRTTFLVMDEADRMFDMGFEPQVMKIVNNTRPDAQKVLFSATFPKSMESLARRILIKPLEITVGGKSVVAAEIDQRVEVRDEDTKFNRLLEILGEMGQMYPDEPDFRVLIFVERQEAADDLFRELLNRGYLSSSLHGGKDQVDRQEAIRNFKNGDIPIIVATSVAARGLDVKELKLVINYDAPSHMEDYVHRAGRTGRAGNTGTCITFITPEQDKLSVDLVRALEASKAFVPDNLKEMADEFMKKLKAGTAKAHRSGYVGHGLDKLQRKREEKDRAEKHTYGDTSEAVSLSSREGAVIPYKPKTNEYKSNVPENSLKGEADYTYTEINVEVVRGPAPDKLPSGPAQRGTRQDARHLPSQTLQALEQARKEGRHIDAANLAKIAAKLQKQADHPKAAGLAAALAPESGRKTKDPDATDWHAVFPINDYPQKARWKATNKEQMLLLSEISGASITMRGVYYPPGQDPAPGQEPKLHLLIESNDERRVRTAVDELRRIIIESSVAALQNSDRNPTAGGRYSVM